jgi:hypothetical protein
VTISPNRAIVATIAFLALTAPAEAAHADDQPPDQPIMVTVVAINGTGCRADSYEISARPDNTGFTLSYRDFRARADGLPEELSGRHTGGRAKRLRIRDFPHRFPRHGVDRG